MHNHWSFRASKDRIKLNKYYFLSEQHVVLDWWKVLVWTWQQSKKTSGFSETSKSCVFSRFMFGQILSKPQAEGPFSLSSHLLALSSDSLYYLQLQVKCRLIKLHRLESRASPYLVLNCSNSAGLKLVAPKTWMLHLIELRHEQASVV